MFRRSVQTCSRFRLGARVAPLAALCGVVTACTAEAVPEEIYGDGSDGETALKQSARDLTVWTPPPRNGSLKSALAFAHPYVRERVVAALTGDLVSSIWKRVFRGQQSAGNPVVVGKEYARIYEYIAFNVVYEPDLPRSKLMEYERGLVERLRISGTMHRADDFSQTCGERDACMFSFRVEFDPPPDPGWWPFGGESAAGYRTFIEFTTTARIKNTGWRGHPIRVVREDGTYREIRDQQIENIQFTPRVVVERMAANVSPTEVKTRQCSSELEGCVAGNGGFSCLADNPCNVAVGALTCGEQGLQRCVGEALLELGLDRDPDRHGGTLAKECFRYYCQAPAVGRFVGARSAPW